MIDFYNIFQKCMLVKSRIESLRYLESTYALRRSAATMADQQIGTATGRPMALVFVPVQAMDRTTEGHEVGRLFPSFCARPGDLSS